MTIGQWRLCQYDQNRYGYLYEYVSSWGCPFYILPETSELEFKVSGEKLIIKPKNPSTFVSPYPVMDALMITLYLLRYGKTRETSRAIDISYDGALFNDPLMSDVGTVDKNPLNNFISSIETNKKIIMQQKN